MAVHPGDAPATPTVLEAASQVAKHRRYSERRLIIIVLLVVSLLFAIVCFLGAIGLARIETAIDRIEEQNRAQLQAIEEARLIAAQNAERDAQNAERQDRILLAIGERLVPKAEVRDLGAEVRRLRAAVAELTRALRSSGASSSGAGGGGGARARTPGSAQGGPGAAPRPPARSGPGRSCSKPPPSHGNRKHCGR